MNSRSRSKAIHETKNICQKQVERYKEIEVNLKGILGSTSIFCDYNILNNDEESVHKKRYSQGKNQSHVAQQILSFI